MALCSCIQVVEPTGSEKSDETCGLLEGIPLLPLDVDALNLQASKIFRNWGEVAQALFTPAASTEAQCVKRPALKD